MQQTQIKFASLRDCRKNATNPAAITERVVCAGNSNGDRNACKGDRGSPLVVCLLELCRVILLYTLNSKDLNTLGYLHNDVILLLRPECYRSWLSSANYGFCYLNLAVITKFEYEKKTTKRILVVVVNGRHRANGFSIRRMPVPF